jgi:hypothetical protein
MKRIWNGRPRAVLLKSRRGRLLHISEMFFIVSKLRIVNLMKCVFQLEHRLLREGENSGICAAW